MKKLWTRITAMFITGVIAFTSSGAAEAVTQTKFTDVPSNAWYAPYVQKAVSMGVMSGSSATRFNPNGILQYGEAAAVIARSYAIRHGETITGSSGDDQWYDKYIKYGVSKGFVDADINPATEISHFAFAYILYSSIQNELDTKAFPSINDGIKINGIPDLSYYEDSTEAVYVLYLLGVLTGSGSNHAFKPNATMTRAECATILVRLNSASDRVQFSLDKVYNVSSNGKSDETMQDKALGEFFQSSSSSYPNFAGYYINYVNNTNGSWYLANIQIMRVQGASYETEVYLYKFTNGTYAVYGYKNN